LVLATSVGINQPCRENRTVLSRDTRKRGQVGGAPRSGGAIDARRRAAVEIFARHEETLRRTARRYSLCADDVDDALQRALEIVLTKAPTDDPKELIRWTQTVTKHEALAVRQSRERILTPQSPRRENGEDWVASIPANSVGPAERVERRETIARSREALKALKPQELRALTLLAEGYSYVEIERITGFSQTKVNRCLSEGRERFRKAVLESEDGSRCAELRPLLSPFCDGQLDAAEAETVREHLRACAGCRAVLRAYRAAPHAAAALAPALPVSRSLFERAHDSLGGLLSRLPGQGAADAGLPQVAATGGVRGAGATALAKLLAVCAGTAGATACVATGVVPVPLELGQRQAEAPRIERPYRAAIEQLGGPEYEPAPEPEPAPEAEPPREPARQDSPKGSDAQATAAPEATALPEASAGAVEYTPEPPAVASPSPGGEEAGSSAGSAAGEFGP
jgi:RNA polymerase sigma factor (sigma-70 family)